MIVITIVKFVILTRSHNCRYIKVLHHHYHHHLPSLLSSSFTFIITIIGEDDLYQVRHCIGTGAFAEVYSAFKLSSDLKADDSDRTEVILKVQLLC